MRAPDIRRSAGHSNEQEYTEQLEYAAKVRAQREADARFHGLRSDWARDFSNSELDDYIALAETIHEGKKPFSRFHAGIVLSVIIVIALLLSLQGCGGGDPEPEADPTVGMVREGMGPHHHIQPVPAPPECEDYDREGTMQTQQWRDACDGPNT